MSAHIASVLHIAAQEWAKDIMSYGGSCGDLPYPLVCDPDRKLASSLGIMDPAEKDKAGLPLTCRSVFFINPQKKLAASILYPATTGRSFKEILRVLDSLQVNWTTKCNFSLLQLLLVLVASGLYVQCLAMHMQLTEKYPVATPVEWIPGGTCCVVPTLSEEEAKTKLPKGHQVQNLPSGKAYLRLTPDPSS